MVTTTSSSSCLESKSVAPAKADGVSCGGPVGIFGEGILGRCPRTRPDRECAAKTRNQSDQRVCRIVCRHTAQETVADSRSTEFRRRTRWEFGRRRRESRLGREQAIIIFTTAALARLRHHLGPCRERAVAKALVSGTGGKLRLCKSSVRLYTI